MIAQTFLKKRFFNRQLPEMLRNLIMYDKV